MVITGQDHLLRLAGPTGVHAKATMGDETLTPLEIIMRVEAAAHPTPRARLEDATALEPERPPPRATLPPLKERLWTATSQRRILQDELIGVALYRHLSDGADMELISALEDEFHHFLVDPEAQDADGVFCLRFPTKMSSNARYLIHACAARFHFQTTSFGEDSRRFVVVYKHPRDSMAPVLRLSDYALAASYYVPPAAAVAASEPPRKYGRFGGSHASTGGVAAGGGPPRYELGASERPLVGDYSRWVGRVGVKSACSRHRDPAGYECEIADCHEHLLELRFVPALSLEELQAALPHLFGDADTARQSDPTIAEWRQPAARVAAGGSHDAGARRGDNYLAELAVEPTNGHVATSPRPLRLRPLPDGFVAVFEGRDEAEAFMAAHADPPVPPVVPPATATGASERRDPSWPRRPRQQERPQQDPSLPQQERPQQDPSLPVRLSLAASDVAATASTCAEPIRCTARPLAALQRRRRVTPDGNGSAHSGPSRGGVPRQLQAALRGLGHARGRGTPPTAGVGLACRPQTEHETASRHDGRELDRHAQTTLSGSS